MFNKIISSAKGIKVVKLDHIQFQNGRTYFESGKRMFVGDNPCSTCVIIHNNYILSHSHKVYRFREQLLWSTDEGSYYSSINNKYLKYYNPVYIGERNTMLAEEKALKNAFFLARLLNRIVIFPKFYCYLCAQEVTNRNKETPTCAANIHFNINKMDHYFKNRYRENSFLMHPKVPEIVKSSISELIFLKTNFYSSYFMKNFSDVNVKRIIEANISKNKSGIGDLLHSLKQYENHHIIQFHSLYGDIVENSKLEQIIEINKGIQSLHTPGFKTIKYLNTVV